MLILANKALTEKTFAIVFVDVTSRALEQIPEHRKCLTLLEFHKAL